MSNMFFYINEKILQQNRKNKNKNTIKLKKKIILFQNCINYIRKWHWHQRHFAVLVFTKIISILKNQPRIT
jgi:hypothetical protein